MKIPGLDKDVQERLDKCSEEIAVVLDKYFPEFRCSYPGENFDYRLSTTIYLELIHARFFKE